MKKVENRSKKVRKCNLTFFHCFNNFYLGNFIFEHKAHLFLKSTLGMNFNCIFIIINLIFGNKVNHIFSAVYEILSKFV